MKIQRVRTRSFAVSKKAEKIAETKAKGISPAGKIKRKISHEHLEVRKAYRPVVRLKLSRQEAEKKGFMGQETVYKIRDNFLYVDLKTADIYFFPHKLTDVEMVLLHLEKYDILSRLMDLSDNAISTLGELMETDCMFYEELDNQIILEMEQEGLIKTFKPSWKVFFSALWAEFNPMDDKITVKRRVEFDYEIPRYNDPGWDLSEYLKEDNTLLEDYEHDNIKYSIDKIKHVLSLLYTAKVEVDGVTYLPYIRAVKKREDQHLKMKPEMIFPVCRANASEGSIRKGEPLRPIALGTALDSENSVPVESVTINFSDVANLEDAKKEIRQAIIYPLTKPKLAKEFGRKGGGSILMYGPPGCGKTYIARATVGECGVTFFNVNVSDIISKGVEEGANRLHDVFEEASRNPPAIIFFDELDAIGGRRVKGRSYAEKMEVDQFLMEMDGVDNLGKEILVMAATNVPWNIDPALRRSVRFTKQIFIPPPDFETRQAIFKIHMQDLPVKENLDFAQLAEMTESYSASDIKAICDRAAEIPWNEALKGEKKRKINEEDFHKAVQKQKSSLIPWFKVAAEELKSTGESELFENFSEYIYKYGGGVDQMRKPDLSFRDVGDLASVKEEIRKNIVYPILREDLAKEFRKEAGSLLLYGPPGCGKTYIARAAAGECEANFFDIRITDIISEKEGESEKNIRDVFERANKNTPAILFFDEIDGLAISRELSITGKERRVVDILLEELENSKKNKNLMVLAATNFPWVLDPAIMRTGRFSRKLLVSRPDKNARVEIFDVHTRDLPLDSSVDLDQLAEMTEGYASSDIKEICDQASDIPWKEALEGRGKRQLSMDDFLKALDSVDSSLAPWYSLAKKQIEEAGKEDEYRALLKDINAFGELRRESEEMKETIREERKKFQPALSTQEKKRLEKLRLRQKDLEKKVGKAKFKYHKRNIDNKAFRNLVQDYQKKLINVEIEIEKLLKKANVKREESFDEGQESSD